MNSNSSSPNDKQGATLVEETTGRLGNETGTTMPGFGAATTDNTLPQGKRKYKKRKKEPHHFFSVQPKFVTMVKKPKTFVNHR